MCLDPSKLVSIVPKIKKRVRFHIDSDSLALYRSSDVGLEAANLDDLWYSYQEYDSFKCENCMIAVGIRQQYRKDNRKINSYGGTLMAVYKSCLEKKFPSDDILRQLARWQTIGVSRRGLEKQIVRDIYKGRRTAIQKSLSIVLNAQILLKESREDKEEQIRTVYEKVTTSSRMFAIVLAQADMLAVNGELMNSASDIK
jgi:hypothetical protein